MGSKKQQIFSDLLLRVPLRGGGYSVVNKKRAVALWAIVLLTAHLQRQAGLSTVGEAHLLAVDWLGWICYQLLN